MLGSREDDLVAAYHAALCADIPADAAYPMQALRDDLELAVADYARFMAGWGFWGNASWAEATAARCLHRLDGGVTLDSEEAYIRAVALAYPFPEY